MIPQGSPSCYDSAVRNLVVLFIHFIATLARLLGPGGVRSIVAESLLLKHQLLIVNRSPGNDRPIYAVGPDPRRLDGALGRRSLIAFTAWSSFAHAAVMTVTAFSKGGYRGDLWGVAVLVIIGVTLIVLAPAKESVERLSAADV